MTMETIRERAAVVVEAETKAADMAAREEELESTLVGRVASGEQRG